MITNSKDRLLEKLQFVHDEEFNSLEAALERIEIDTEDSIKPLLQELGIRNSVKTDRKSLRIHKSVSRKKYITSYFNGILDTTTLKRMFVRELLESGQGKLRFFVDVQPMKDEDGIYGVNYTINWYEHECN